MYCRFVCKGEEVIPAQHFEVMPKAGDIVDHQDSSFVVTDGTVWWRRENLLRTGERMVGWLNVEPRQ